MDTFDTQGSAHMKDGKEGLLRKLSTVLNLRCQVAFLDFYYYYHLIMKNRSFRSASSSGPLVSFRETIGLREHNLINLIDTEGGEINWEFGMNIYIK